MERKILTAILFGLLSLLSFSFILNEFNRGISSPQPIGPYLNGNIPNNGPALGSGDFEIVNAFPNLTFTNPIYMTHHPNEDRMLVTTWGGMIYHFPNIQNTTEKTLFADLTDISAPLRGGNLLGLVFHPEFGQNGSPNSNYVYIYYAAKGNNGESQPLGFQTYTCPDESRHFGTFMRLSRFEVNNNFTLNKASELRMINYRLANNSHRGGGMVFGNDGFLYLTLGDQSRFITAQNISDYFEGGVIRIDVDQDPTKSHAPIRKLGVDAGISTEYSGIGYGIPNDNPFTSPGGQLFEEFYAVGLRNPFKMTRDRVTGEMWIGDVGHNAREEINILESGANFGWPRYEGNLEGTVTQCGAESLNLTTGIYTPPLLELDRSTAVSITGGYVYRGTEIPSLIGKYIWADHGFNSINSVEIQPGGGVINERIGTFPESGITSFGEDISGELYMCHIGNNTSIYKLQEIPSNSTVTFTPPQLLSQTGAFSNLSNLTPAQGVLPYDMIEPFWSDGADKKRWIAIPNNGTHNTASEQINFSENGDWELPIGTVVIKHFDFENRKLETRFEVRAEDGNYYYLTYKWNNAGTDAILLDDSEDETFTVNGVTTTWHFPSRTECLSCHQRSAGSVIGLKTRYLNKDFTYPSTGITANQLVTLSSLGILNQAIDNSDTNSFLTAAAKDDDTASLEFRARSYLDLNCSYCHRPETSNRAVFNALLTTPLGQQNLLNGNVINDLGIAGGKIINPGNHNESVLYRRIAEANTNISMPPLAKLKVDNEGIDLIKDWINSLENNTTFPQVLSFSDEQNANPATGLIDGSTAADDRWSAQGFPQTIVIDYGSIQNIIGTRLWTYQNRAYQYTVELSNSPNAGFTQIVDRSSNTTADSPIENDFPTVTGRYVRITVTGAANYSGPWVSLTEFELNTIAGPYPKIASFSNEQNGNPATDLIDGSIAEDDRWSAQGFPQTVVIDYGETHNIVGTQLWTYQNRAYQYTVEVSNSPNTGFIPAVNRSNNTTSGSPIQDNFAAVAGRYVRIIITGASGYSGPWVSLTEFDIITTSFPTSISPVIASFSNEQSINPAEDLIDGSTDSEDRWSASGFPQSVVIDYGEQRNITGTELSTYQNRAYQYTIEVSDDLNCDNFQTIVDRTSNTTSGSPIVDNFAAVEGRFVRITVVGASGYAGTWVSLTEFDLISTATGGGLPSVVTTPVSNANASIESFSSEQAINPATGLIDGSTASDNRWSAQGFPQSVVIDYGEQLNFSGTRLSTLNNRAYQYTIEISNSPNTNFETIVDRSSNTTSGSPIADDFSPKAGRYIRIIVTGASGYSGPWVSLTELEMLSTTVAVNNEAITFYSDQQALYPASNLIDGSTAATDRWSAQGFPQSVIIDYGQLLEITGTNLWTLQNRAYQYTVEVSTDLSCEFQTLVDRSSNTTSGSPISDNFTSTTGRYIRLTVTGASGYTGPWVSLTEFELISTLSANQRSIAENTLQLKPMLGNKTELTYYLIAPPNDKSVIEYTFQHYQLGYEGFSDLKTIIPDANDNVFSYQYIHDNPSVGDNFYQVEILYDDNSVSYSELKQINFDEKQSGITLAPNPVQEVLYLDLSNYKNKKIDYFITSLKGDIVLEGTFTKDHLDIETIDLQMIKNGLYIIYNKPEGLRAISQKLVVLKDY